MKLPETEPFRALLRLPLPTWRRPFADYFVALLARSPQYSDLVATLATLADAEQADPGAVQRHFDTLLAHFQARPELIKTLATIAELPAQSLKERNHLDRHRGETLLQIDLQEANYQVLSHHADGALPPTWSALCASLGVPAWYAACKLKRQQLLGLFEPKTQVRVMRRWTAQIVHRLEQSGHTPVYVAHDEVIARGPLAALPWDGPRVRQRLLREDIVDDTHVRTLTPLEPAAPQYRTLHAVPRHLFFRRFKTIVLGEQPSILDDLFAHEGGLCLRLDEPRLAELAALIPAHRR